MRIAAATFAVIAAIATTSGFQAQAVTLKPVPPSTAQRLPIQADAPGYACAEIADKLEAYNTMARSHDQSITSYLGQVTEAAMKWYTDLLPEAPQTTRTIAKNDIEPMNETAQRIGDLTNLAFDNSELLAGELDRIIVSLRQCSFK